MRRIAGGLVLVLALLSAPPTPAQMQAADDVPFTTAEEQIIGRNELLARLRRRDPDIVKDILKAMAHPPSAPSDAGILRNPQRGPNERMPFDPTRNPDLAVFHRSSSEAAHDLLQLLKQAGALRR